MPEILTRDENAEYFETHHENGELLMCMGSGGECKLLVEIQSGYESDEERQLIASITSALEQLDSYIEGKADQVFAGLHIVVGEGVAKGGAEADAENNRILLNGRKMLLSIDEMRVASGAYDEAELVDFPDTQRIGSALEYTIVHEIGHILDGQTEAGDQYSRVDAGESPTKYGSQPDEFNQDHKDHEAFAEGFAHLVWGMPVSDRLAEVVSQTIQARIEEIAESRAA